MKNNEKYKYNDFERDFFVILQKYKVSVSEKELKKIKQLLKYCYILGGKRKAKVFLKNFENNLINANTKGEQTNG